MPNWCCNCEIIAGPKEEVKKLRDLIEEWTSKNYVENGFGLEWLGNIVIGAGFTIYDDDPVNGFYCRGNLSDALEIEEGKDGEDWELHFQSLTAGGPMPQMWYAIVAKYAPHCKYYYYSEEHGNQFYESNDIEHRFFPEEYFVDVMYYEDDKAPEKIKKCIDTRGRCLWQYPVRMITRVDIISGKSHTVQITFFSECNCERNNPDLKALLQFPGNIRCTVCRNDYRFLFLIFHCVHIFHV